MQLSTLKRAIGAVAAVGTAALALAPSASAQDAWPARRITVVVPFGAGSSTDALARIFADQMKDILGQPIVVENRGGAGGTLGANVAARAAPDGYTILWGGNTTHSAAPAFFKSVPYDPIKDFTAIARVGRFTSVVVTNAQQPYRTIQAFVAFAKANPGKLTYGHGNSTGQMVGEAIKKRMGLDIARLSYPSTAPASADLLGNNTQMIIIDANVAIAQQGKMYPLATFALQRSGLLPDVPSLHETIMPEFQVLPWTGLFGPAGIPADVVKKLAAAAEQIIKRPDTPQRLAAISIEPFFAVGEPFAAYIREDIPRWRAAAKEAGIEPQ